MIGVNVMLKVECRYRAKLDLIGSLLTYLESNDELTIDDIIAKLRHSELFYRNSLVNLED